MTAQNWEHTSVSNILDFPNPHGSEGFFDPPTPEMELPQHDPQIDDWTEPKVVDNPYPGVRRMITTIFTLDSGAQHVKRDFIPDNPSFDSKVGMMTALGTRVNGMNSENALRVAAGGSEVTIVGFNQAAAHPSSLSADAEAAAILIGYRFDRRLDIAQDWRQVVLEGKSRGAMGAFGVSAYAPKYLLEVPVSLHQDPCLARPTSTMETLLKLTPVDVADELWELGRCIIEHPGDESITTHLKRLGRMAKTIGVTPDYLLAQIHSGRALWAGEAGGFIDHIPADQVIIANFFNKNRLNHHGDFGARIQRHQYGRIVGERLRHMALIRHAVMEGGAQKIWTAQAMVDLGKDRAEIADALATPFVRPKTARPTLVLKSAA